MNELHFQVRPHHTNAETSIFTIDTTVGELICAIADAAKESMVDDADIAMLTKQILESMVRRYNIS